MSLCSLKVTQVTIHGVALDYLCMVINTIMMDLAEVANRPDVQIIDVREQHEFDNGHIAVAIHMPLSSINDFVDELKQMKGPKFFYCRSGNRSGQVVTYLSQLGMAEVYNGGSITRMASMISHSHVR